MQKTMGMWAMAMFVAAGSFTLTGCGDSSSETSAPTEAAKSDVESGIGAAAKAVDDTVTKVGDVAKIVEAAAKAYPLDTCIVSGKKIESMDDAITYVHEGQEVKFCCGGCVDPFKNDPAKHLAKLASAAPVVGD